MGWCVKDSLPSLRVVVFFAVMAWVSFHKLRMLGLALVTPLAVTGWGGGLAWARPVVCTTTLEAPDGNQSSKGPVEVSQCGPLESTGALIERRFYSWTAPYARGVDVLHQLTDMLGIAVAGQEGNRLMGFGFPDQTIIWDGSAVQNTYQVLLEEQSPSLPWRTVDISSGFDNSLAGDVPSEIVMVEDSPEMNVAPEAFTPVRGMW
ncbi:MAG: occludin/ELL family protein [Cyanobacteriota bacterium]|nr:occludin/ELL family protein [Cyanobacteriota bacterium]